MLDVIEKFRDTDSNTHALQEEISEHIKSMFGSGGEGIDSSQKNDHLDVEDVK